MSDSTHYQDQITLDSMSFYAYHGVNPEERTQGQWFVVDIRVDLDLSKPGRSDRLDDTVNYTDLYHTVKTVVEGQTYNLLEAVAEAIARQVLDSFPVLAVWARVIKPSPPIKDAVLQGVSAEVYRERRSQRDVDR
jgi:dihydroneopterin aldolase